MHLRQVEQVLVPQSFVLSTVVFVIGGGAPPPPPSSSTSSSSTTTLSLLSTTLSPPPPPPPPLVVLPRDLQVGCGIGDRLGRRRGTSASLPAAAAAPLVHYILSHYGSTIHLCRTLTK